MVLPEKVSKLGDDKVWFSIGKVVAVLFYTKQDISPTVIC